MQPLLDGPRTGLRERVVRELLQSHRTLEVSYGADALDDDFSKVADISNFVSGGNITSNIVSTIHRVCTLSIDANVTEKTGWSYLSGFIRPFIVFADPESGDSARFNLGVYTLTTPSRVLGSEPATMQFSGYDLIYLLRQQIGDSYEVAAGTDPAQAAATVIGLAIPGVEVVVEDSGSTLDVQLTWPLDPASPVTYLEVVQTLLSSIGYRPVWVDWEGRFQIGPFIDLQGEQAEWTFDTSDTDNIVADERTQDVDLFNVPNWFRFVMADLTDSPAEGTTMFTWEDSSEENPGSTVNRGRQIKHVEEVHAVSYEDLLSYAQRRISDLLEPSEMFTVKTQPFPLAWHYDLIEYLDEDLANALPTAIGARRLTLALEWKLDLSGQSDMEWRWLAVTNQSAADEITESEVTPVE